MKFLFIFLCIFLIVRFLFKPILKLVIQLVLNKLVNNQGASARTYTNFKRKSTGNVDVDYVPPKTKSSGAAPSSMGEYIDYEEIK